MPSAQAQQAGSTLPRAALSVHEESLLANAPFDNPNAMRGALSRGAQVDARDAQGRTALIVAAGYFVNPIEGVYGRVKRLLESAGLAQQANLGFAGNRLAMSVRSEQDLNSEAARYLLRLGAQPKTDASTGQTVLAWEANNNGNTDTLQILLDAGADVNARDRNGRTALMIAAQNANQTATQLLLDRHADLNLADNAGLTALGYAANRDHAAVVQALMAKGATADAHSATGAALLRLAIGQQNVAQVRDLLEQGASANGNEFDAPLITATHSNNAEIARLLIEHGADVNRKVRWQGTLLQEALFSNAEAVAKLLLDKGINPNGLNVYGQSSLEAAALNSSPELFSLLLDKGADPNSADSAGTTPLHLIAGGYLHPTRAVRAGPADTFRREQITVALAAAAHLLDKGAAVNARERNGTTPLLRALQMAQSEMALLLIQRGADVNLKNDRGEAALQLATRAHLNDVTAALRAAGAKE